MNSNQPEKYETLPLAEEISFKGIKFGMKAKEIAELGGGNTKRGCASAIASAISVSIIESGNQPWTYGGIDDWTASCVEGQSDTSRVPGTSGMYKLTAFLSSNNNALAKLAGEDTYSVDGLVEIFSKVFGKFKIDIVIVKNGLGQEFEKKIAITTHKDAAIQIKDDLTGSNHEAMINIAITSLDYLKKKVEWERQKDKKKLDDAKADF